MAEGATGKKEDGISRRDFIKSGIKKGAIITAGLVSGGVVIDKVETSAIENGISTESGIFYPLYETHYKGLNPDKIPNDLNILLREVASKQLLTEDPKNLFENTYFGYSSNDAIVGLFPEAVLKKLTKNNIEIMVGDVRTEEGVIPNSIILTAIEFFAGVGLGLVTLRKTLQKDKSISRRKFLKIAGTVGTAWLTGTGGYFLARGGPLIDRFSTERDNALNRIIDRVYGLQTKLHPEQLEEAFFRDLIMADKMLAVAEDSEKTTGRKAKIGFNVEYAHNGIEDFLRLGPDMCRWIIAQYPKSILLQIMEANSAVESLWVARLLKFPTDFEPTPNADWSKVIDRKVEDTKLRDMVIKKWM